MPIHKKLRLILVKVKKPKLVLNNIVEVDVVVSSDFNNVDNVFRFSHFVIDILVFIFKKDKTSTKIADRVIETTSVFDFLA